MLGACHLPLPADTSLIAIAHLFSYGTAKSGVGITAMSVIRPDLMMRSVVPVIMAGIIAVCISVQFLRGA